MTLEISNSSGMSGASADLDHLIAQLNLSMDQLRDIKKIMDTRGISFIEAAISLQLVSPAQLDSLVANVIEVPEKKTGIIESAFRKAARRAPSVGFVNPDEYCTLGERLTIAHDPYSERSEKFRGLRTELSLRLGTNAKASMLAIVSATNGEGRTQLAAELAIAFAQLDRRTLLVDADLRSPGVFKLFNCKNEIGLSQAIAENAKPHVIGVTALPNLHIINSGPTPPNPIELLSTKRFEQLVNGWRDAYDFVIFDTPPVAAYADSLSIATLVKRVLLVTRSNVTRFKDAKEMLRRLSITHSEIVGSVVNHF